MTTIRQERDILSSFLEQAAVSKVGHTWSPPSGGYFVGRSKRRRHYQNWEDDVIIKSASYPSYLRERKRDSSIQIGNETIVIPHVLNSIIQEIEQSRYMLAFEEDWDEEGSLKYDPNTWNRAIQFLVDYSKRIYELFGKIIQTPKILHSVNGSIDLLWKNSEYQLLVNIPSGPGVARFYGDNYENNTVEGSFDPSTYSIGLMLTLLDQGNVAE